MSTTISICTAISLPLLIALLPAALWCRKVSLRDNLRRAVIISVVLLLVSIVLCLQLLTLPSRLSVVRELQTEFREKVKGLSDPAAVREAAENCFVSGMAREVGNDLLPLLHLYPVLFAIGASAFLTATGVVMLRSDAGQKSGQVRAQEPSGDVRARPPGE